MTRTRRLLVAALVTVAAFVTPVLTGAIAPAGADDWLCAGSRSTGGGYCLSDPLPDHLPLP